MDITEVEEDANIEYPSHEASEEMSYIFENLPWTSILPNRALQRYHYLFWDWKEVWENAIWGLISFKEMEKKKKKGLKL